MITVRMTLVDVGPPCRIRFADGTEFQFDSVGDMVAYANAAEEQTLVQRMCIAYLAARSSGLTNPASTLNKDFIFDLSAPQPIRVQ